MLSHDMRCLAKDRASITIRPRSSHGRKDGTGQPIRCPSDVNWLIWAPITALGSSHPTKTAGTDGSDTRGSARTRRACAPLFCGMRRSSTYSGSGDLRASSGAGPSESLAAPFDLTGARSWSASSLVLGCFLPRKDKAAWMTQAMYPPMSFWPPEDQLLHYACAGDEPQSSGEPAAEEARERSGPREEATEPNEAPACKVPSSEVLVVAKVPAPRRPRAPGDSHPLAPPPAPCLTPQPPLPAPILCRPGGSEGISRTSDSDGRRRRARGRANTDGLARRGERSDGAREASQ